MKVVVSTTSSTPIYVQLKTQIRASILSGEAPEASLLPSLRQLAADLRISTITVTRAYNDLAAEGLVRGEHGRGFVVQPIDPATATIALEARVTDAIREVVAAARLARIEAPDVHRLLDEMWSYDD